MAVRVNRAEFLEALNRVSPGLSTKDFIEQASCFVFKGGWINTFNDEITCRTKSPLPADVTGAVRAKQLLGVIENFTDDDVDLSVIGGEFRVQGKRKKAGVRMEADVVLPVDQVEPPSSWADLPEDFPRAVEQVQGAAGTNAEEFITTCVHLHPEYLEATDRKQATRYTLPVPVTQSFLIRAVSLAHVVPLGLTRIGETDNWVHFRNKTLVFSCRRHIEDYPTELIGKLLEFRGVPTTLPKGAGEAAKLGSVFTADDKENDKVTVKLTDGHMVVRGEGAHGWASADLEMAYHGQDVTFRIAPAMLEKLVKDHNDCEIAPGKLMVSGDRWRYLTVLGAAAKPVEPEPAAEPAATE